MTQNSFIRRLFCPNYIGLFPLGLMYESSYIKSATSEDKGAAVPTDSETEHFQGHRIVLVHVYRPSRSNYQAF